MALSIDLRERIIEAIDEKDLSKAEVIRIFNISRTGLDYLLFHYKETGSLNPKPHGGGRPSKFNDVDIEKIKKFIEKRPDATLEEILEYTGKDASLTSLYRTLKKIGYRLKKSHYLQVSKKEKMLRQREPNGKK
jgi:transposase